METVSEFIRQNGAFGVLVLLIMAFVWKGLPWLVSKYTEIQKQHDSTVTHLTNMFDNRLAQMDHRQEEKDKRQEAKDKEFTSALNNVADKLSGMSTRLDKIEDTLEQPVIR